MEPCTCELDTDVIKKLNKDPSLISEHRDQSFKIIQFVQRIYNYKSKDLIKISLTILLTTYHLKFPLTQEVTGGQVIAII